MPAYTTPGRSFTITLPEGWGYTCDEDCYTFFREDGGVGALQISVLDFADIPPEPAGLLGSMLREGHMPDNCVENAVIGGNSAARMVYEEKGRKWNACVVVRGARVLYTTYNCLVEDAGQEWDLVQEALETLEIGSAKHERLNS